MSFCTCSPRKQESMYSNTRLHSDALVTCEDVTHILSTCTYLICPSHELTLLTCSFLVLARSIAIGRFRQQNSHRVSWRWSPPVLLIALLACPLFVPSLRMAAIFDSFVYLFMPTVYVIRLLASQYTRVASNCRLFTEG